MRRFALLRFLRILREKLFSECLQELFHRRKRHGLILEILACFLLFFVAGVQLVEDVVEMHLHVTGLDAFGGLGTHGGEIVGQAHGGGHHHQLGGGGVA